MVYLFILYYDFNSFWSNGCYFSSFIPPEFTDTDNRSHVSYIDLSHQIRWKKGCTIVRFQSKVFQVTKDYRQISKQGVSGN